MLFKKLSLLALAATGLLATQSFAGLLGSTVTTQYYAYGSAYNGGGSPDSFVANGTAQNQFFNYYTLTVSDHQIEYDYLSDTTWSASGTSLNTDGLYIANGNRLTFSGAPLITGVTLDGSSTVVAGFSLANLTYNSTNVAVDWQNVSFHAGDKVVLNISPAPEPETYAMMIAGLGLVGTVTRRKKVAAAA